MELKPCPFCGGVEMRICDVHGDLFVRCGRCGARTRLTTTQKEAVDAWQQRNTRAERTCHMESMHGYTDPFVSTRYSVELSCHTLEDWPDSEPPEYCPWCGAKVVEK